MVFPFRNRASELLIGAGVPTEEVVTIIRSFEKLTFGLILADAAEGLSGKREWAEVPEGRFLAYSAALHDTTLDCEKALRSEEHTSELQSLMRISYAVFCLKKKNY